MREVGGSVERVPFRPGRCATHPAAAAVGDCDRCGRPLCLSCAIPVRGQVLGPECLSKVVQDAPATTPAAPIRPHGDWLALIGFALVLVMSVFPWSRFGSASGFGQAWALHWSLLAVAAGAVGVVVVVWFRRRPMDPRLEAGVYAALAALIAVGAVLHAAHPPPLSGASAAPWLLSVLGSTLVLAGAAWKVMAPLRRAPPS